MPTLPLAKMHSKPVLCAHYRTGQLYFQLDSRKTRTKPQTQTPIKIAPMAMCGGTSTYRERKYSKIILSSYQMKFETIPEKYERMHS